MIRPFLAAYREEFVTLPALLAAGFFHSIPGAYRQAETTPAGVWYAFMSGVALFAPATCGLGGGRKMLSTRLSQKAA